MIASSANRYFSFWRRTAYVMDPLAAALSMTLDRALNIASHLQVDVAGGTTGSGTVTITGNDPDGAPQIEVLTFTTSGSQQTTGRWLAGSTPTIATTGLSDEASVPTVAVQAIGADGHPHLVRVLRAAQRPVLVQHLGAGDWKADRSGTHETGRAYFDVDYEEVWRPKVGDILVEDDMGAPGGTGGEEWSVKAVPPQRSGGGVRPRAWRLLCERLDT